MNPRTLAFSLSAAVFVADRLTKMWIQTNLALSDVHTVIPGFFDIVHSQNRGAAFSLLAESSSQWRGIFLIGVALAAMVLIGGMLWNAGRLDRATRTGLALIFGGAAGNVFDRIATGTVTDFLDFYVGTLHWPAFNLADSAIVIGSGLLLLDLLKPKRQPRTDPHVS